MSNREVEPFETEMPSREDGDEARYEETRPAMCEVCGAAADSFRDGDILCARCDSLVDEAEFGTAA